MNQLPSAACVASLLYQLNEAVERKITLIQNSNQITKDKPAIVMNDICFGTQCLPKHLAPTYIYYYVFCNSVCVKHR